MDQQEVHTSGLWCKNLRCNKCYSADTWQKSRISELEKQINDLREENAALKRRFNQRPIGYLPYRAYSDDFLWANVRMFEGESYCDYPMVPVYAYPKLTEIKVHSDCNINGIDYKAGDILYSAK